MFSLLFECILQRTLPDYKYYNDLKKVTKHNFAGNVLSTQLL